MFRLALALGCTVRELGMRLSAAELIEWQAFSLIEPFGGEREDDRARGIMAVSAQVAGNKLAPSDFLKVWEPAKVEPQEGKLERLVARLDALALVGSAAEFPEGVAE